MKAIHLHGAATRNDGQFVDAGITLEVGDKDHQINAVRAEELVSGLRAVEDKGATAPATSTDQGAADK